MKFNIDDEVSLLDIVGSTGFVIDRKKVNGKPEYYIEWHLNGFVYDDPTWENEKDIRYAYTKNIIDHDDFQEKLEDRLG